MQFDYEIPVGEYVAGQMLYYKASAKGQVVKRALGWVLLGLFFLLIALSRWVTDWPPILLSLTAVLFIYWGITILFPIRHYRRYYAQSGLAGKKYHAELDKDGFLVTGDACSWHVLWTEVLFNGEDKRVFMFSGKGTIFIFGKRYLPDEQQIAIRQLAVMR
jgi:hypothetical protein